MAARGGLKVLLLQIRDHERVRREEHLSFAEKSGLSPVQIDIHNVFDRPNFGPDILDGYDALFIGGASEASVLEPDRYAFVPHALDLVRESVRRDLPTFASCFGFQLAVVALGGKILRDERDFEMGTVPIALSAAAAADPLYRDTRDGFMAVSVHRERALSAPPNTETLAFTSACCHSFRVEARRFWAFQFHPEVDKETLVERLTIFKTEYTEGDAHLANVLSSARETPESNALLKKFVDRVLLELE
jgi:GMP synthase (glutamine-hydrolysing)